MSLPAGQGGKIIGGSRQVRQTEHRHWSIVADQTTDGTAQPCPQHGSGCRIKVEPRHRFAHRDLLKLVAGSPVADRDGGLPQRCSGGETEGWRRLAPHGGALGRC